MRRLLLCLLAACTLSAARPLSLAGTWRFRLDPEDRGVREGWAGQPLSGSIRLPGTTDEAGAGERTTGSDYGMLTRAFRHVGPAWYQRTITVPAAWRGHEADLFLERVTWQSRVWVDGVEVGGGDSLGTPHTCRLGPLAPGRHTLTLRIDNRMIHPIGDKGHAYGDYTQSVWNGVVGRLELRPAPPVRIESLRAFPSHRERRVEVELGLARTAGAPTRGAVDLRLTDKATGKVVATGRTPFRMEGATRTLHALLRCTSAPRAWGEFDPALYELRATLAGSRSEARATVGFRDLGRTRHHVTFNDRPVFFRGNLDCVHFPLTGYPAMDVEAWRRIFRLYREHGLNHVRFHAWCPPEAAFTAADELGISLQVEVLWIDHWMGRDNPGRPEMDTPGRPQGVGRGDRSIDTYVQAEMRRMLAAYGNHPSFVFFCIGNELGSSDFKTMGAWIEEARRGDPRHLYAASTARTVNPGDDFCATHHLPEVGATRGRYDAHTDWDFEAVYGQARLPVFAHEIGQWPVYPEWAELGKYQGVLKARNLEALREKARAHGILAQDRELRVASGGSQSLLYKHEIEGFLRTPSCGGIQLLSMQDYPGQGEALIGWRDAFWEDKGLVRPEAFRRYMGPTVPLARLPKFVFRAGEPLRARLQVAHWGPRDLRGAVARWSLKRASGEVLSTGTCAPMDLPVGTSLGVGEAVTNLPAVDRPERLRFEVALEGTPFVNGWNLWAFPQGKPPEPAGVTVCDRLDTALEVLRKGGRVLLLAHGLGTRRNEALAAWMPLYWSASFFPGQHRETLGALVRADHPALAGFPTEGFLDWQWRDLCRGARGFILDGTPDTCRPIVQPVSDFHFSHKLGALFEAATPEGGRLLVCGYNLAEGLDRRPEAAALRASLLAYMAGDAFRPAWTTDAAFLRALLPFTPAAPPGGPAGFERAALYVRSGALAPPGDGMRPWAPALDEVKTRSEGFRYHVEAPDIRRDQDRTAWAGRRIRLEIRVPSANLADLHLRFHDWDRAGRAGLLRFEGRTYALGAHPEGRWVRLDVLREDANDGVLVLEVEAETGEDLLLTDFALVPRD